MDSVKPSLDDMIVETLQKYGPMRPAEIRDKIDKDFKKSYRRETISKRLPHLKKRKLVKQVVHGNHLKWVALIEDKIPKEVKEQLKIDVKDLTHTAKKCIDKFIERYNVLPAKEDRESIAIGLDGYLSTLNTKRVAWWRYDRLIEFLRAELDSPNPKILSIVRELFSRTCSLDKIFYSNLQKEMFENNKFKEGGMAWKIGKILENPNLKFELRFTALDTLTEPRCKRFRLLHPAVVDYFVELITNPGFSWKSSFFGLDFCDDLMGGFIAEESRKEIVERLQRWVKEKNKKGEEIPEKIKKRIHTAYGYVKLGESG